MVSLSNISGVFTDTWDTSLFIFLLPLLHDIEQQCISRKQLERSLKGKGEKREEFVAHFVVCTPCSRGPHLV